MNNPNVRGFKSVGPESQSRSHNTDERMVMRMNNNPNNSRGGNNNGGRPPHGSKYECKVEQFSRESSRSSSSSNYDDEYENYKIKNQNRHISRSNQEYRIRRSR